MRSSHFVPARRRFLQSMAFTAAAMTTSGLFAEELAKTAALTEGPFYPDKLPLDTDNDLLIINDAITPAVGEITHLTGRILTSSGQPVRNAFVEIWQVDNHGAYLHTGSDNGDRRDKNFQGYGRFLTDSKGQYYFRTIKPVPYPGRTPHIHFGVSRNGQRIYTTQMLVNGHPQNATDFLAQQLDAEALKTLLVDFQPLPDSKLGELTANFDIVLGVTTAEPDEGIHGIGRSDRDSGRFRRRGQ